MKFLYENVTSKIWCIFWHHIDMTFQKTHTMSWIELNEKIDFSWKTFKVTWGLCKILTSRKCYRRRSVFKAIFRKLLYCQSIINTSLSFYWAFCLRVDHFASSDLLAPSCFGTFGCSTPIVTECPINSSGLKVLRL